MKPRQRIVAIALALVMFISLCACTNSEETEIQDASNTNARSISQEELATEPAPTEPTASSSQDSSKADSSKTDSSKTDSTKTDPSKTDSSAQVSSPYTPRPKDPETLSADTEEKIKADYVAWEKKKIFKNPNVVDVSDVIIEDYYGTYNGGEVLNISISGSVYLTVVTEENIAGYNIWFPSNGEIYFHKNAKFYSLEDAYAKGLLTKQDIRDIKWYLNDVHELQQ